MKMKQFLRQGALSEIFGDDKKMKLFLRWMVQILEKGIKLVDFNPSGVNAMIQIIYVNNMPKK